jgi:carboxypeptidase C (cathepsin A)
MYEAGHMMYIHEPSLVKYKEDLARFIRDSH